MQTGGKPKWQAQPDLNGLPGLEQPPHVTFAHHNVLSVFKNGVNRPEAPMARTSLLQTQQIPINDGLQHTVRVVYANRHLRVFLDGIARPLVEVDVDFQAEGFLDPEGLAWMGFTGSTGLASENHDILRWRYCHKVGCGSLV